MGLLRRLSHIFQSEGNTQSAEHLHDNQQYSKKIVLENGECVNVRGNENQINKIRTNKYTITNITYLLIFQFFKRYLNLYLFIIHMIYMDYNYLTSLILTFTMTIIVELYFDQLKKVSDENINSRLITVFTDLKKCINTNVTSTTLIGRQSINSNIKDHEKMVNTKNYQRDLCIRKASVDTVTYRGAEKSVRVALFQLKRWDQLKVGEIVYLKHNEICPADILILDMGQQISVASNIQLSGNTNEVRKRACGLTTISKEHNIQLIDYRTILNGFIRYDHTDSDQYYKGIVKLKKDPQAQEINKENIFFREQQLLNDLYMFGVVLAVGMDCRCYKSFGNSIKLGYFENKANYYFIIAILTIIVISVVQYLIEYYGWNHPEIEFKLIHYSNLLPLYFYFIIDLINLFQIINGNQLFDKQHKDTNLQHQLSNPLLDGEQTRQPIKQVNYSPVSNMSLINHVLFDKTGTLTLQKFKIKWVFIFDSLFKLRSRIFDGKEFKNELKKNSPKKQLNYIIDEKNEPDSSPMIKNTEGPNFRQDEMDDDHPPYDELHRTQHPKFKPESLVSSQFEQSADGLLQQHNKQQRGSIILNSQLESKRTLQQRGSQKFHAARIPSNLEIVSEVEYSGNELTLLRRTQNDEEFKSHYMEAMLALLTCHNTRSLFQKTDDSFFYEYGSEIDRQQLQFCKHYGFKYICRSKHEHQMKYIIQENEKLHSIDVIALHSFNSRKLSIIVRLTEEIISRLCLDLDDTEYIQYLRDDSLDMIGCLSLEKEQMVKLELMIKDIQTQGSRPILFYRNLMNEQQMQAFVKEANKLLDIQSNKIESMSEYQFLMHEFERNCDLVSVIGISEKIRKHTLTTINQIKSLGIPCWITSGDNYEKVLPVAYKLQLINPNEQVVHIYAKTQDELFLQLKQQLQNLSGQLRTRSGNKEFRNSDSLKKGSFTCSPRWISGNRKIHIKQFQIIINGDSLELITKDTYLNKHFQFILQFSSSLIGYRMTPQQKTLLVKLLKYKKLKQKTILAIGDSYSDIGLFNSADYSIQILSESQIYQHDQSFHEDLLEDRVSIRQLEQGIQETKIKSNNLQMDPFYNSDIFLSDITIIYKLLTIETRKSAMYFERILTFSLFRSFNIIFVICVTQIIQDRDDIISNNYLTFHNNVFFILSTLFIIAKISETIELCQNTEYLNFIFQNNQMELNTNRYIKYLARITLFPLFQALIINLYLYFIDFTDQNGKNLNDQQFGAGIFLLIIYLDTLKLVQRNYITDLQLIFNIVTIYAIYTLLSFQFQSISIIYEWLFSIQTIFSFLFILFIHSILNIFIYFFNSPFFQPLLVQTAHQYDNIIKIQQKISTEINRQIKSHRATFEKISYFAHKLFKNEEEMDPIIKQMLNGAFADETENSINQLTLKFKAPMLQKKFLEDTLSILVHTYRIVISLTFLIYEIATYIIVALNSKNYNINHWSDIYYIVMLCVLFFITLYCWSKYYKQHFFIINFIYVLIRTGSIIIWLFNESITGNVNLIMIQLLLAIEICHYQHEPILSQFFAFVCAIIYLIVNSSNTNTYNLINQYVIVLATFTVLILTFRRIIHIFLEVFLGRMNMNKENQIMGDILSILLPQFIRDRINKQGGYDIQEDQGMVGVLFCDIIDFDQLIKTEQSNVVDILDKLFRKFDSLCQQHEVMKIETVGKTYMAAAGLKIHMSQKSNPVNKVISLALDMKKYVMSNENFQIKIGIHYGTVIAGVIGHHKPQFSLIGDTINTASRVCSTAQPWEIQISEQAYRQTNKMELVYTPHKVEAKGKGVLNTYVVSTKRGGKQRKQTIMIQRPAARHIYKESKEYNNLDQVQENSSNQVSDNPITSNRDIQPLVTNVETTRNKLNQFQMNEIYKHVTKTQKLILLENSPNSKYQQQMAQQLNFNLNAGGGSSKNYASNSFVAAPQSGNYDDRQQKHNDLIQFLEKKIRCDLNVSDYQINMEYEVEKEKLRGLQIQDEENYGQTMILTLNPKKFYLQFNEDNETTKEFQEYMYSLYKPFAIWYQLVIGLCISISSLSVLSLNSTIYIPNLILGTIIGLCYLIISYLIHRFESVYNARFLNYISYLLLASYGLDCFTIKEYDDIQIAKGIIYLLSVNLNRTFGHEQKLIYNILQTAITIGAIIYQDWNWGDFYYSFIITVFGFSLQLFMFYKNVNSYNVNKQLVEKSMKYQFLLNYLLPKNVLEEFFRPNEEKRVLREQADEVTLLFADIAGFTEYSSKVQPEQVVNMLRNLFTEFDKICLGQNVFKLYTIGDCYVVMGMIDYGKGVQRNPSQEAVNVVRMGFQMIDVIRRVRAHINHPTLDMRIGVHTGSIIGGVLGTDIVRYDIYGPDVLIANKMESKGAKGFVQVSQETKDIIEREFQDLFRFEFTQQIEFESIERKTSGYFVYA